MQVGWHLPPPRTGRCAARFAHKTFDMEMVRNYSCPHFGFWAISANGGGLAPAVFGRRDASIAGNGGIPMILIAIGLPPFSGISIDIEMVAQSCALICENRWIRQMGAQSIAHHSRCDRLRGKWCATCSSPRENSTPYAAIFLCHPVKLRDGSPFSPFWPCRPASPFVGRCTPAPRMAEFQRSRNSYCGTPRKSID